MTRSDKDVRDSFHTLSPALPGCAAPRIYGLRSTFEEMSRAEGFLWRSRSGGGSVGRSWQFRSVRRRCGAGGRAVAQQSWLAGGGGTGDGG